MKQEFYKVALENIQLARQNGYPQSKLEKLAEREQRCLEMIRSGKSKEDSFQKKKLLGERLPANKKFPFYIADCLTLEKCDTFGNHIRTNHDIKTGTLVASESPVAVTKLNYERCEYCKTRNLSNLIPCNTCTRALYCSEKCRQEAFESYHKYFCGVDRSLPLSSEEISILKLFCFGLNCFQNSTEFFEFLRETEDSDATGWDVDFRGMDQKEINKNLFLVMNSFKDTFSSRPQKELVEIYKRIAFITANVLNYSKLKDIMITKAQKAIFRNFVFRQMKLVPQYYFGWGSFIHHKLVEEVCYGTLSLTNFFNNSCAPNVQMIFHDSKLLFHTIRPIKKGEQLFVGYVATHDQRPVEVRQANMKKIHGYVCKCEACEQPHKYPLEDDLQIKDPAAYCHSLNFQRELRKIIQEFDVDAAVKQFRLACDYLDSHGSIFPSNETNKIKLVLQSCMMVVFGCDEIKSN